MLSEKILNILEQRSEIEIDELKKELKIHYGVLYKVLKDMQKNNKIIIEKKKQPHKPKKYKLIVRYTI